MPFVCDTAKLRKFLKTGKQTGEPGFRLGECVALVKKLTGAPQTVLWREGLQVKGNGDRIAQGTAIATFVDGRYPQGGHAKHSAIYMGQDKLQLWVVDQWPGRQPPVGQRRILFASPARGRQNNGDAFSVIETADSLKKTAK